MGVFVTSRPQESAPGCGEQVLGQHRCQGTLGLNSNQLHAPAKCWEVDQVISEEVDEPDRMMATHLICDCAGLVIYEDLLGDVHAVSIFEISDLVLISLCLSSQPNQSTHLL